MCLEKDKPESKLSPKLTPKAPKRKRSNSGSPTKSKAQPAAYPDDSLDLEHMMDGSVPSSPPPPPPPMLMLMMMMMMMGVANELGARR